MDLEGFLARLMERDTLSKATRNRYLAFLKSLFKVAVRWGYVAGNPTADIKQIKETPKRTRHLTAEQLARLMQVLKSRGGRDWVFPSPADPTKPFHTIRKSLIAAGQEAGIGPVHHHMFRTSLITDMVNANVNPFVTQQVVGHKNIATTQSYYRRSLGAARKAMEQVQAHRAS